MLQLTHNIPILCYHTIGTPDGHSLEDFCDHLEVIREMGFQTITAQEVIRICRKQKQPQGRQLVITFDDGHVSNWLYAVPELEKRGMRGVFFPITDFIWDGPVRTLKNTPILAGVNQSFQEALEKKNYSQFMTRQELVSLVHDAGMEIYSHTTCHQGCFKNMHFLAPVAEGHWSAYGIYEHPKGNLPTFEYGSAYAFNGLWPELQKKNEIIFKRKSDAERYAFCLKDFRASLEIMKNINQIETQFLCWPWGHFDKITVQAAKDAGYEGAFSLNRFRNGPGTNPFYLHRIAVAPHKDVRWLRNRLLMHLTGAGAMTFYKFFRKKREFTQDSSVVWDQSKTS